MQSWAESKQQPGQFTGSTGAHIMSQAELASGYQAWARKVDFSSLILLILLFSLGIKKNKLFVNPHYASHEFSGKNIYGATNFSCLCMFCRHKPL